MLGVAAFPALLPTFIGEWQLTNTDAGWINGIYFAGYLAAVPVLVGLGVDELSVSVRQVPMVKARLRGITEESARLHAETALAQATSQAVRDALEAL